MRQRTINNLIEISPQVEGNFLTQAFPTNFHQFYTKKLLTPQESVSDYKEVTAAEKANIINADSQWVEPSEELITTATAAGAVYNTKSGYFELNTLVDITTLQMRNILYSPWGIFNNRVQCPRNIRTNLQIPYVATRYAGSGDLVSLISMYLNTQLEVLKLCEPDGRFTVLSLAETFANSPKLRKIIGPIELNFMSTISLPGLFHTFDRCFALEDIQLAGLNTDISFPDSSLISLASIEFMINRAVNTTPITVTVHPDVYAKLTSWLPGRRPAQTS